MLQKGGIAATFSMPQTENPSLWHLLAARTPPGSLVRLWAVVECLDDEEGSFHRLGTTEFKFNAPESSSPSQQQHDSHNFEGLKVAVPMSFARTAWTTHWWQQGRGHWQAPPLFAAQRRVGIAGAGCCRHQQLEKPPPKHYTHNKSVFNGIDLHDRDWCLFCDRTKMLLSLLDTASVNAWVLFVNTSKSLISNFVSNYVMG